MKSLTKTVAWAIRFWVASCVLTLSAQTARIVKPAAKLPTEDVPSVATSGSLEDRKIDYEDMLEVTVVGEKELSNTLQVSGTGEITPPYLTPVKAKGKTPNELKLELEKLWSVDVLVNPQVIVTVKNYRKRTVSIVGQVNKESILELPPEQKIDIVSALAQAGGIKPTGNKSKIDLTRRGGKTIRYKLDDLVKTKVYLEPDDVVNVQESAF